MGEPKRIQRKRTKGWTMPAGAVYVGRPTLWGNPFVCERVEEAVKAYRMHISMRMTQCFSMGPGKLQFASNLHPNTLHHAWPEWAKENLPSLRGKDLACWCALDKPCHADVLLELANAPSLRGENSHGD